MEIQGLGQPVFYNQDSNIISVEVARGKRISVVDELPEPEDERDFVLINERQYMACEGINYRRQGFCKLGDTWVYPDETPAAPERQGLHSLEG